MSSVTSTFAGEMQLAGWSETHTGGCKVTFWLQSSAELDAFRALTVRKGNVAGHRFMAALVEIGDDEQPVQPPPAAEPLKGGELAKLAGKWCANPEFWHWLNSTFESADYVDSAKDAAALVRYLCCCESRRELDHDAQAARNFHTIIRGPFSKWMTARGVCA